MQNKNSNKPLLGADNNALIALLSINLVVYAFIGFFKVVYYLNSFPEEQFYAQIMQPSILVSSTTEFLQQPWTILTYYWVHDGFWVLLTNMIWLLAFGYLLQEQAANKHIFPIYFYAGILAGLSYILLGADAPIMGAQVGVMALAMAVVSLSPDYRLLKNIGKGIPVWILALVYLIIQALSLEDASFALVVSYLVAASTGLLYVMLLNKGRDLGKWMHQLLALLNNSLAPKK
ncbi:MAG: rhomboid family intramembrane serine protease [Chitinophagaceae bacterium]|nr:rhomboid family intramembrane serine protease [Chitinophagaceae bacterium]